MLHEMPRVGVGDVREGPRPPIDRVYDQRHPERMGTAGDCAVGCGGTVLRSRGYVAFAFVAATGASAPTSGTGGAVGTGAPGPGA